MVADSQLDALAERIERDRIRRECLRSFAYFTQQAWPYVQPPSKLVWSPFLDIALAEMQAWGEGRTRNLILAFPPGTGKSIFANLLLPLWVWLRDPSESFLSFSHNVTLSTRDMQRMREVINTQWFQETFRPSWGFARDQNQKTHYKNTEGGSRQAFGGKSGKTGWRANKIVIDDPIEASKAIRSEDLDTTWDTINYVRRTRVNDSKTAQSLLIMQRVHEADPVGRALKEQADEWKVICFDMEMDPAMKHRHPDDKRAAGEILAPERYGPEEIANLKKLGDTWNAHYQHQPVGAKGGIIKNYWLQYSTSTDRPSPSDFDVMWASWDLAFEGEVTSSWVVGTVWGATHWQQPEKRKIYLIDRFREHVDITETRTGIAHMQTRYPGCTAIVIEKKANGYAVLQDPPAGTAHLCKAFEPGPWGSKAQRLQAVAEEFRRGRVYLPAEAPWLNEYIEEITKAPKAEHWDQCDSTSQAILWLLHVYDGAEWSVVGGY